MATTHLTTIDQLEGLPQEGRFELIDGELIEMAPSGGRSSKTGMRIGHHLSGHVLPRGLGEVFGADGGFVLFPDRETVRVPDVAFVRADRLPPEQDQDGFLRLAPDLAVEVISPTDRMTDVMAKVMMYLDAGVRLVWVADPRSRTVTVYAADRTARLLSKGDELGGEVLPGFRVRVGELYG
jgi:Uma2 family endonuclease